VAQPERKTVARIFDGLFPTIASFANLHLAWRKAARGKRGQPGVASFELNLEGALLRLQEDLLAGRYRPGPYRSFTIRDPKHRLISAAPFRDRVVHHALCNVIEPLFERTFIGDSYANRIGKGTHAALVRAQRWARHYPYVLQCDLRQFFPSVDHAILQAIIRRKIADPLVLGLVEMIVAGGAGVLDAEYDMVYFPGDDLFAAMRPRGLPIGNLTSQFWANVYLNELDQFVKRELRCHAYLRYVDDFLLFADNKRTLWQWKAAITGKLAELRLALHERESTVYPTSAGIPFLGFRVYPDHRLLKRRNALAFQRRLRRWGRALGRGEMPIADLHPRVRGWVAHAAHGDTWGLRRALFRAPLAIARQ
jgi:RNA-directed DNA polymerase